MHYSYFIIALLPPLLYSIGNILDKKLVSREGDSNPLLIVAVSSLLSIFVMPLIYLFNDISAPKPIHIIVMIISGMLTALSVLFYLKALETESVFSVAPALQLTPVFSYILGVIFFREFLSLAKLFGCLIIILGAFLLNLKIESLNKGYDFKIKVFGIIALSSFFLAFSGSLFKFFAIEYNYWTVQFFEYLGLLVLGLSIIFVLPKMGRRIKDIFTLKKFRSFALLNISTETIMVLGDLTLNYAILILPMTIAFSFNSMQPVFLIFVGLIIKEFSKRSNIHIIKDHYDKKTFFLIGLITLGAIITVVY